MPETLHLEIISPQGQIYGGEIEQVSIPTESGEITILPHHANLYGKVVDGEVVIQKSGKREFIAVLGGFVEISQNVVTILSDYAIPTEKIITAHAQEAKMRAERLMREKTEEKDFSLIERDLQKSILELQASEKARKRRGM